MTVGQRRFGALRSAFDIDFHVAITLLYRGWGILAGGLMIFIVPSTLNPSQQGYYFTFTSLLALQIFFELGLNQVVVQLVSHEMAHLKIGDDRFLLGPADHLARLTFLVKFLAKWYSIAAALFALVAGGAGILLFSRHGPASVQEWLGPWLLLVVSTAFNLRLSPMLAMTEGSGQIGQVARLRLTQSIAGYGLTWVALLLGFGLWAIPVSALVSVACTTVWIQSDSRFLHSVRISAARALGPGIDWKREVLPFQWRIAVSWISGYLLYQLFTPLVFANLGPVIAGRLGIAIAIFNAILSVGVSWINTKAPSMTAHASRGERVELDGTFLAVTKRAGSLNAAAALAVVFAVYLCGLFRPDWIARIADVPTLLCLAVHTVVTTLIYAAATYMRSYREEPMMVASAVGGILTLVLAYVASSYGTFPTMLAQSLITVLISAPWTWVLLQTYRRRTIA